MSIRAKNLKRYPDGLDSIPVSEWYCRKCFKFKDKHSFYFCPSRSYAIDNICKECNKLLARERSLTVNFPRIDDNIIITCIRCAENKRAKEYHKNRHLVKGISSWCKECHRIYIKRWHERTAP